MNRLAALTCRSLVQSRPAAGTMRINQTRAGSIHSFFQSTVEMNNIDQAVCSITVVWEGKRRLRSTQLNNDTFTEVESRDQL